MDAPPLWLCEVKSSVQQGITFKRLASAVQYRYLLMANGYDPMKVRSSGSDLTDCSEAESKHFCHADLETADQEVFRQPPLYQPCRKDPDKHAGGETS